MKMDETWRKATKSNNNGACVEVRVVTLAAKKSAAEITVPARP